MNVVLDTNVVVSALMSALGNPAKILSLFSDGEIQTYYSHDIMAEYEDVLPRPELKIKSEKIKRFLSF
jgi:putative PIN family toxin of toxin-antitoxin system